MNRLTTPLLALAAAVSLTAVACGGSTEPSGDASAPAGDGSADSQQQHDGGADQPADLIGLELAEAEAAAAGFGKTVRVIEEDGRPLAVTADIDPDRIDLILEDGVVTDAIGELDDDGFGADIDAELAEIEAAIVGLDLVEAQSWAAGNGYSIRVAQQDGERLEVTDDLDLSRVNVAVTGQTVAAVLDLG